jgi:hypothetical protein
MTAGRSLSAIQSAGPGSYFSSAPRHRHHRSRRHHLREVRRARGCGPRRHRGCGPRRRRGCGPHRRRQPRHIADRANQGGRRRLHPHPGRIRRNDRRRHHPRLPCRLRGRRTTATRRRGQNYRRRPPLSFTSRRQRGRPGQLNRRRQDRPPFPGRRRRNRRNLSRDRCRPYRRLRVSGKRWWKR